MKIGVSAFVWASRFGSAHLNLLPRIRDYGIECVEIPVMYPLELETAQLRRALEANDLGVSVCAILPNGTNPISPHEEVRSKAVKHLRTCINVTADLGGRILCGPVYAPIGYLPHPSRTSSEWDWAIECFQQLIPLLAETGVTLALEPVNRSETHFMKTCAEGKRFCETLGHSNIGITLDTFHANIEEKDIAKTIPALGDYLKHIHMSENDRGVLGSGHIDFLPILRELERIAYRGILMVEGFGTPATGDILDFLWRDQAISSDDLAKGSTRYLGSILGQLSNMPVTQPVSG